MRKKLLCALPFLIFILICVRFHCAPSWAVGAAFCHQFAARSPMFGTAQLPFCFRCAGLFAGIFCALLYSLLRKENEAMFSAQSIIFLAAALIFYAIDILNSTTLLDVTIYPDQTHTRFLSGFAAGAGIAGFILPMYRNVFHIEGSRKPSLLLRLGFLLVCAFLFHAAVYSNSTVIEFPLRIILCLSAVIFLILLYSLLIQAVSMAKGNTRSAKSVYLSASAFALLQIDLLSFAHLQPTASGLIQF